MRKNCFEKFVVKILFLSGVVVDLKELLISANEVIHTEHEMK